MKFYKRFRSTVSKSKTKPGNTPLLEIDVGTSLEKNFHKKIAMDNQITLVVQTCKLVQKSYNMFASPIQAPHSKCFQIEQRYVASLASLFAHFDVAYLPDVQL